MHLNVKRKLGVYVKLSLSQYTVIHLFFCENLDHINYISIKYLRDIFSFFYIIIYKSFFLRVIM